MIEVVWPSLVKGTTVVVLRGAAALDEDIPRAGFLLFEETLRIVLGTGRATSMAFQKVASPLLPLLSLLEAEVAPALGPILPMSPSSVGAWAGVPSMRSAPRANMA